MARKIDVSHRATGVGTTAGPARADTDRARHDHAAKLRQFTREFFLIEAAEAGLRHALRVASVELQDTKEFKALKNEGATLARSFLEAAIGTVARRSASSQSPSWCS